jgi:Domain of unknown function (DUF4232)
MITSFLAKRRRGASGGRHRFGIWAAGLLACLAGGGAALGAATAVAVPAHASQPTHLTGYAANSFNHGAASGTTTGTVMTITAVGSRPGAIAAPSLVTAASSAAPRCGIAHPALAGGAFVWASSIGDGFAGGAGLEAEITNVGLRPCTVHGVPGVAAVDSDGHLVGTRVPGSSNGPLITLQPRATAHVDLTVHDALAVCAHPVSARVVLYLSGHKTGQDTFLTVPACPGKPGGGVLGASVIRAGTGIPLYDD